MKLAIVPIFQAPAFAYIEKFHRHHIKPVGSIFQLACSDGETKVTVIIRKKKKRVIIETPLELTVNGVVTVGRPIARKLQDGITLEVTRLCTDGTKNACSMLYAAAWRIAREMGYKRLITYILQSEAGTSLRASGWTLVGARGGGSWSVPSRPRTDKHPLEQKQLFEMVSTQPK